MSPLLAAIHFDVNGVDVLSSSSAEPGRPAAFLMLLAFLVTWLFIRTSARLIRMQVKWWPGNVETSSGLHIHHLVWGIVLMMISGFVAFATNLGSPWWELTAILFGVGVGLTLDEYALWLHLEDVYWAEEGRSSIDAVVIAFLFASLVVVGARPLDLDNSGDVWLTVMYSALALAFALITLARGRLFLGVIAFFIPLVGIYCACRLGKPRSIWARKRYPDATSRGRRKLERAQKRWPADRWSRRLGRRLQDLIGGTPSPELQATPAVGDRPPPADPPA
jgi:hypothetical protein